MARKSSDLSVVIGLAVGFGGLAAGFLLDGGKVMSLVGVPAIIMILAGTFGAVIISFSLEEALAIPAGFMRAMQRARGPSPQVAEQLLGYSDKARRDGLLSLEDIVEDIEDETMRKGLRMVVDGVDADAVIEVLESDYMIYEQTRLDEAAVFDAAGGFSPTMGIIGTVMGLVLVLTRLGGADPAELGRSVATAFIATLYGIGFANLLWLPIANKLRNQLKKMRREKQLIIMGIRCIQQGEAPGLVREKLEGFLSESQRKELSAEPAD